MSDFQKQLGQLGFFYLERDLNDLVARATKGRRGPMEIIEDIVRHEIQERDRRSLQSRLRCCSLGKYSLMADFDWSWPTRIDRTAVERLLTLGFIEEPANVILAGPAGVGKSMIAKNLALQAVLAGHSAMFVDAAKMLTDLGQQETPRALEQKLKRYLRPKVLVLDEVGYLSYGTRAGDLMFQVIAQRYEKLPTIITTNIAFKEWNTVFPGAACVTAMIDRLTHHAEIVGIDGESYRTKQSSEKSAKQASLAKAGKGAAKHEQK
jgi:DNA replication protein DnaC